jgi:signal transduction histidine kinase
VDQTSEERRQFKVRNYLEHILSSLRPALRKAGVQCVIDCEDEIEIESFPGALSQIITNLAINAITHAFDGKPSGAIRIAVRKSDDRLELEFGDDGKGMSADILAKIYDPFFTTKRGAGGSGLGLHIVYNLVTQTLKGSIVCRSQPDQGTTFAIHWPLKSDMNPAHPEPQESKDH